MEFEHSGSEAMRDLIGLLDGDPQSAPFSDLCRYSILMYESAVDTSDSLLINMCDELLNMTQLCVRQSWSRSMRTRRLS